MRGTTYTVTGSYEGGETKQGSRPSCRDQEGSRGSEEVVPENLGVPLQGDWDAGELCRGASRVP